MHNLKTYAIFGEREHALALSGQTRMESITDSLVSKAPHSLAATPPAPAAPPWWDNQQAAPPTPLSRNQEA